MKSADIRPPAFLVSIECVVFNPKLDTVPTAALRNFLLEKKKMKIKYYPKPIHMKQMMILTILIEIKEMNEDKENKKQKPEHKEKTKSGSMEEK